ncbi:MAG: Nre family DNA repair protein [Halobacteriota archaeon]
MKTEPPSLTRKEVLLRSFKLGKIEKDLFGATPPAAFVGRFGYPDVLAGPLVSPLVDQTVGADEPDKWLHMNREDIIGLRSNLVRSNFKLNVKDARDPGRLLQETQELAMAELPVDVEVRFERPPKLQTSFDSIFMPMGPSGIVEDIEIIDNPRVPRRVDTLADERDIKAADAALLLYEDSVSPYQISRLLSVGVLGEKRLLVPTRWSITATDSILGNDVAKRVQTYPEVTDVQVFSAEAFGNHFEILLIPRSFSFGWTEVWLSASGKAEVGDLHEDRLNKPAYMDGGYYAARFSALEYLEQRRRQAAVYVMREVQPSYDIPLGSWVIRETVKEAFSHQPLTFSDVATALAYARTRVKLPVKTEFIDKCVLQTNLLTF